MNLKKIFHDNFIMIFIVFLLAMGFYGNYHSSKKHNNENPNILLCLYYGLESFWHKYDYSELNDNVRVAIYLLMYDPNKIDPKLQLLFNQSKKQFKSVISKCDKKEAEYIRKGAATYLEMKNDFENQCYLALINYKPDQTIKIKSNKKLVEKLSTYGLEKEIKALNDMEKDLNAEMNEQLINDIYFAESIVYAKELMRSKLDEGIEHRTKLFKELFE